MGSSPTKKYKVTSKDDLYKFDLVFDGELVENSADAFDVANTIIALTNATREMVRIKFGEDTAKQVTLNINAFKEGSLKTQFLMLLSEPETAVPTVSLIAGSSYKAYKIGKDAIGMVKDYVSVRKWLKGKKPQRIEATPGGDTYIIHANNSNITIGKDSFKALQDRTVQKSMDKVVEPLEKEGSELESLSILTEEDKGKPEITVNRSEAKYIRRGEEEMQSIDQMRLKGVVTKIDTKVCSGYINLGNLTSKRVSFSYNRKKLPREQFDSLILSLQTQVQIYVIGVVDMDMEGHPRSIDVSSVEEDEKLL